MIRDADFLFFTYPSISREIFGTAKMLKSKYEKHTLTIY